MVTPLVQLQQLEVQSAKWLNARVVLVLQLMLPQLQHVGLKWCGKLVHGAAGAPVVTPEAEQQALSKVQQLLRPGLELAFDEHYLLPVGMWSPD